MNNPQQSYLQQVAQWRQDRMRQQAQARQEEIKQEYAQAARERDEAIADNRMDDATDADNYCQNLEAEWSEYHPPQPPQMDPQLARWGQANKEYIDRLIAKHGVEKTNAFLNAIDAKLTGPRNQYAPEKGGLGLKRNSPEYFARGNDFLELYSEGVSGERYTPNDTLTAEEAAKISGISPQQYNRSAQVLNQQGRFSWQQKNR
jgi:hypothetical protein